MTITAVKAGGWDPEDVLTSDEMNAFQERLLKAIDGVDGGTYELQDDLVFDGTGVVVIANDLRIDPAATLTLQGSLDVEDAATATVHGALVVADGGTVTLEDGSVQTVADGAQVRVDDGGDLRILDGGTVNLNDGAVIDLNSGAQQTVDFGASIDVAGNVNVANGGNVNLANGAKIVLTASGAEIKLASMSSLKIDAQAFGGFHTLTPVQRVAGEWDPYSGLAASWLDNVANGTAVIPFALALTPGDTLSTVVLSLRGQAGVTGHAALPATPVRVILSEIAFDGTVTSIDAANDGSASAAAFNAQHTITLSGGLLPRVVVAGSRLIVTVRAEGGAGAEAGKTLLLGLGFTGIARAFRVATLHI